MFQALESFPFSQAQHLQELEMERIRGRRTIAGPRRASIGATRMRRLYDEAWRQKKRSCETDVCCGGGLKDSQSVFPCMLNLSRPLPASDRKLDKQMRLHCKKVLLRLLAWIPGQPNAADILTGRFAMQVQRMWRHRQEMAQRRIRAARNLRQLVQFWRLALALHFPAKRCDLAGAAPAILCSTLATKAAAGRSKDPSSLAGYLQKRGASLILSEGRRFALRFLGPA